jgi:hypothetical protein
MSWRLRLSAFFALFSAFVLIDEIIEEGYGFDYRDLFNLALTHEKLFVVFISLAIYFGWRRKK